MLEKIKNIKFTPKRITFCFYFIVINLSIILFIIITLFLYKNLYQSITQSKEIIILREKVVAETVNINKFNEVIDKFSKKINLKKIENINNPFE